MFPFFPSSIYSMKCLTISLLFQTKKKKKFLLNATSNVVELNEWKIPFSFSMMAFALTSKTLLKRFHAMEKYESIFFILLCEWWFYGIRKKWEREKMSIFVAFAEQSGWKEGKEKLICDFKFSFFFFLLLTYSSSLLSNAIFMLKEFLLLWSDFDKRN